MSFAVNRQLPCCDLDPLSLYNWHGKGGGGGLTVQCSHRAQK
jgi:hypothetical protein